MPSNAPLTENDLRQIEHGGGLKEATEKERDAFYNSFSAWVAEQGHTDITELECTVLEDLVAKYFFTMRVTPKGKSKGDGQDRRPMGNSARKYFSQLKVSLIARHKIDFDDKTKFPNLGKRMKAFFETLADEGLAKTNNYEEIPADSLDEIYKLIYHVFGALKHRADPKLMNEHLQHIPSTYHRKLNYLAQYGAQLVLLMLDVRRGNENLSKLKVSNFKKEHDSQRNVYYWKKVVIEKDKNHAGSEDYRNAGLIPFLNVNTYFNPGEILEQYIGYLPDPEKHNTLLFTQPKLGSKKFDILDPANKVLYHQNLPVGINTIATMLPNLSQAAGVDRVTNHQVRPTVIKNLRRSGFAASDIMKLSGHSSADTIAKSYDGLLDPAQKVDMAAAICFSAQLQRGAIDTVKVYENIPKNREKEDASKVKYFSATSDLTLDREDGRFEIDIDKVEVEDMFDDDSVFGEESLFQMDNSGDELLRQVNLDKPLEVSKTTESKASTDNRPNSIADPQKPVTSQNVNFLQNPAPNLAVLQNFLQQYSANTGLPQQSTIQPSATDQQNICHQMNTIQQMMSMGFNPGMVTPGIMNPLMQNNFLQAGMLNSHMGSGFNNFGLMPNQMMMSPFVLQNPFINQMLALQMGNSGSGLLPSPTNHSPVATLLQSNQGCTQSSLASGIQQAASNVQKGMTSNIQQATVNVQSGNGLKELQEYLDKVNKEKEKQASPDKVTESEIDLNTSNNQLTKRAVGDKISKSSGPGDQRKRPVSATVTSNSFPGRQFKEVKRVVPQPKQSESSSGLKGNRSCKSLTEGIINTEDEDEDIILTQSLMGGLSGKATPSVMHQSWMINRKRRADWSVPQELHNNQKPRIQVSMSESVSDIAKSRCSRTATTVAKKKQVVDSRGLKSAATSTVTSIRMQSGEAGPAGDIARSKLRQGRKSNASNGKSLKPVEAGSKIKGTNAVKETWLVKKS